MTQKLNDLLFDVKKVDFQETFGMAANSNCSHAIIGNVNGVDTLLTGCSDRYELVPNEQIFPVIESILTNAGIDFSTQYRMTDSNTRFTADYIIEDSKFGVKIADGDIIKPKVQIVHSYNRTSKYIMSFGFYRLVCSNGLVIPYETEETKGLNFDIVGKHTVKIQQSLDELIQRIEMFTMKETQNQLTKGYKSLTDTYVENWTDRLIEVMNVVGINAQNGKKVVKDSRNLEYAKEVIQKESAALGMKGKVNNWLIYNGINEVIFNDDLNIKTTELRNATDAKVLSTLMS